MDVQVEIIMDSYVASQGHTCTTSGNLSLYSQGDFSVECEQGLSGQRDIMYRHNVCEEFVENSTDSTKSAEIPLVPDLSKFRCNIVDPNNNTDHLYSKLSDTTAMAQCSYSFSRDIGSGLMVDRSTGRQCTVHPDTDTDDDSDDCNSDRDPLYVPDEYDQSSDSNPASDSTQPRQEHEIPAGKIPVKPKDGRMQLSPDCHSQNGNPGNSDADRAIEAGSVTPGNNVGAEGGRNLNIVVLMTDNIGSRTYDRKSYCYFCSRPHAKLIRHMTLMHKDEHEVRDLMEETDKAKKKLSILKLRNLGNYEHNRRVVDRGAGEFLVSYRTVYGNMLARWRQKQLMEKSSTCSQSKHCPFG